MLARRRLLLCAVGQRGRGGVPKHFGAKCAQFCQREECAPLACVEPKSVAPTSVACRLGIFLLLLFCWPPVCLCHSLSLCVCAALALACPETVSRTLWMPLECQCGLVAHVCTAPLWPQSQPSRRVQRERERGSSGGRKSHNHSSCFTPFAAFFPFASHGQRAPLPKPTRLHCSSKQTPSRSPLLIAASSSSCSLSAPPKLASSNPRQLLPTNKLAAESSDNNDAPLDTLSPGLHAS